MLPKKNMKNVLVGFWAWLGIRPIQGCQSTWNSYVFPSNKNKIVSSETWSQDREESRVYWIFQAIFSVFKMFEFLRFLYLNLDFLWVFCSMIIFLWDDFLPSSPGTMFSRVDNFPEKFSVGYPPIFLGLEILVP